MREDLAAAVTSTADDASTATFAADDGASGFRGDDSARGLSGNVASCRRVGAPAGVAVGRVADSSAVPGLGEHRPPGRASLRGGTGPWRCQRCLKCVTPCHRPGPGGKGTLCNGMSIFFFLSRGRVRRVAGVRGGFVWMRGCAPGMEDCGGGRVDFFCGVAAGRLAVWIGGSVGLEFGEGVGRFLEAMVEDWSAVPWWIIPRGGACADRRVLLFSFSWLPSLHPCGGDTAVGDTIGTGGCGRVGAAACGLKWRDQQRREEQAAALRSGGPRAMETTGVVATAPSLPPAAAVDGAEQAGGDGAEQVAADGSDRIAAALCAATAEAQAAAAEVVAAADSPAPSGSPAFDAASAVPAGVPPTDAPSDGATLPTSPVTARRAPSVGPPATGTSVPDPPALADTVYEPSSEEDGAAPWWCPQCATPDLPCPRVQRGRKALCEGILAVGGGRWGFSIGALLLFRFLWWRVAAGGLAASGMLLWSISWFAKRGRTDFHVARQCSSAFRSLCLLACGSRLSLGMGVGWGRLGLQCVD